MERELKEIKIGNHTFKVKAYITAGEKRYLRDILLKSAKIDFTSPEPKLGELSPEVVSEFENALITTLVVEMDGSSDNILNRVLEMKAEDFDELINKLDEISRDALYGLKKK